MSSTRGAPSILREIASYKQQQVDARLGNRPCSTADAPPCRDFVAALRRSQVAVIAECKAASPSAGALRAGFDPVELALDYRSGGAACISVLTDERYFSGSPDHLEQVRRQIDLPLLRKDFIVDSRQIAESRALGADAILLIAAILSAGELEEFAGLAAGFGMACLVEVHDEAEMEKALAMRPVLLGINNRDLHRFETDLETTIRLAPMAPKESLIVSESGISSRPDVERVAAAGARAVLVGEALVRSDHPEDLVRELASVPFPPAAGRATR